tara:strand:- start:711 stop:959 length:249 start_codon:yes stop_codon:yes gene_type:complete
MGLQIIFLLYIFRIKFPTAMAKKFSLNSKLFKHRQPVLDICNVSGKSLRFHKGIWRKFGIVQFLFEMFISFFSYLSVPFFNF